MNDDIEANRGPAPPLTSELTLVSVHWQDSHHYDYVDAIGRDGWAWEFLRRNPAYGAAWTGMTHRLGQSKTRQMLAHTARWGCYDLVDPSLSALHAGVLWTTDVSNFVLHLQRGAAPLDDAISAATLARHAVASWTDQSRLHLLFLESGRRLQISVEGVSPDDESPLSVSLQLSRRSLRLSLILLRRFGKLVASGDMPAHLYPPDPRLRRFKAVLQALDGSLAGASHRTIAQVLSSRSDADDDWSRSASPLRSRVRRAIQYGRRLMQGGYLSLLK